jgi:hypothetical protein
LILRSSTCASISSGAAHKVEVCINENINRENMIKRIPQVRFFAAKVRFY